MYSTYKECRNLFCHKEATSEDVNLLVLIIINDVFLEVSKMFLYYFGFEANRNILSYL